MPANTTYVAGSTTLNGTPVPDVGGTSPLVAGMPINAPEDPTPGVDARRCVGTPDNVATIMFDVRRRPERVDGTVISNQGFVSALDGGVVDEPSDDPRRRSLNDPTRDIVGNLPLLFADKRAALLGRPGFARRRRSGRRAALHDHGPEHGARSAATGVVLTDPVPANTTYVADSTTLNGLPVGQPDGGVSPLAAGIDMSSSDLTPPLPAGRRHDLAGRGSVAAVRPARQRRRARRHADQQPGGGRQRGAAEPADRRRRQSGDGARADGRRRRRRQQLAITKQVAVVGGGPAVPGATLEYVVTRHQHRGGAGLQRRSSRDDLDAAQPGYLAYVDQSATLNGIATGVSVAGTMITANYSRCTARCQPGATVVLRFRAVIAAGLAIGTRITNTGVVYWNDPIADRQRQRLDRRRRRAGRRAS